jgi:hypothetical protein
MLKAKQWPEGPICSSNGLPKWLHEVDPIMQRNTKGINANYWMELKTSGAMDELVTWIKLKGPPSA